MSRRLLLGILLISACKAELADGPADASDTSGGSDSGSNNVSTDAGTDGMMPLGPWSTPQLVPGGNSAADEDDITLSSNKLELYFKRDDGGNINLYMMTRATPTSAWGPPTALGNLNTANDEESPRLSPDDLTMYFGRGGDIFKSTRATVGGTWPAATAVGVLNTTANEKWAAVCSNGYVIVSRANGGNAQDLYEGTITTGANTLLTQLNTTQNEQGTFLSADCLALYFQSSRNGAQFDIYMSTRTTTTSAWSNPTVLTDFNTAGANEEDPWISTDQRLFAFASNSGGNKNLYISTR
ncbi:MAG: hypothetical protein HOV81_41185 [Kofleriaceae bacterium]|nr:hypothetical protein [Kofleriaceae bacterium]